MEERYKRSLLNVLAFQVNLNKTIKQKYVMMSLILT